MRLPHVLVAVAAVFLSLAQAEDKAAQVTDVAGATANHAKTAASLTTTALPANGDATAKAIVATGVSSATTTQGLPATVVHGTSEPGGYQHDVPRYDESTKILDDFNPYLEDEEASNGMGILGKEAPPLSDADVDGEDEKLRRFDFDPSEGLTFYIEARDKSCFYEDIKSLGDTVGGAYVVSTASAAIDVDVKDPYKNTVFQRYGDAEGTYEVHPDVTGLFEICFTNNDHQSKLVTHVTNTLQSQHPVEKEHVSILAKYASHLDIKLGELESEQRLMQLRIDRHMKTEKSTNDRVSLAGTIESLVYVVCVLLQIYYIRHLLHNPRQGRSWA
ncbi:hypothetical protein H310_00350 [Aphanomyces invadans]|uniref:GOLD domain-containing protein n=1 Tax=Aphanomyces invadans TaxID=157072 RepID=A0A024UTV1_9STRA|nr:hypothetical protein H310_00350 [Aphanomyces invadans]ETW09921.1 hypothetical protein H310_00350 [Aphanomyces invadans]|eukprot:XP_008861332.1 hypothetical protein H310_00350 [Aphanomyces invadans]